MRRILLAALVFAAAGCAHDKAYEKESVTAMQPGFGVMVATFRYVPGESKFDRQQILTDAKYAAGRLRAQGYESFVVYAGGDTARVGIRASSHHLAEALQKEFKSKGRISLGDGNTIPVADIEVKNIAELKLGAQDTIP